MNRTAVSLRLSLEITSNTVLLQNMTFDLDNTALDLILGAAYRILFIVLQTSFLFVINSYLYVGCITLFGNYDLRLPCEVNHKHCLCEVAAHDTQLLRALII